MRVGVKLHFTLHLAINKNLRKIDFDINYLGCLIYNTIKKILVAVPLIKLTKAVQVDDRNAVKIKTYPMKENDAEIM